MLYFPLIDQQATEKTPFKINEKIPDTDTTIDLCIGNKLISHIVCRKFLGVTHEGYLAVQDFYGKDIDDDINSRTEPYLLLPTIDPVTFPYTKPVYGIDNEYCVYYPDGKLETEAYFTHGMLQGSYIHNNDKGNKEKEIYYMNGRVQAIVIYSEQQEISHQIWGLDLDDPIDPEATVKAIWNVGEKIEETECDIKVWNWFSRSYFEVYRVFLGITKTGCYLVQDYYQMPDYYSDARSGNKIKIKKRTNPYLLSPCADPKQPNYPRTPPDYIEGYYTSWYLSGGLEALLFYEKGLNKLWCSWDENGSLEKIKDHCKDIFI